MAGLVAAAWPSAVEGARDFYRSGQKAVRQEVVQRLLYLAREILDTPSVVLAPDLENTCIPAYSASARTW